MENGPEANLPGSWTRYEHYEVLRHADGSAWELGRGAMGVTYKALDTRLHHHVALKVISADLTGYPDARERFLREARTAARLRHPNIASVFHLGETSGGTEAFYAMEFVEGETLEARVRHVGPLSVRLTLEVGIQVARALVAACHQNLIHRDLKPANLMLVSRAEAATLAEVGSDSGHGDGDDAWVKVIDFGLAKVAAQAGPLTGPGEFLGTPQYASPEQFTAGALSADVRSDIYSLGATLWYALTGTMPFAGRSFTEVQNQKLFQPLPTGQLQTFGVPVPMVRLLTSMLAADPGDRPQTPSLLLEALRRCREELRLLAPSAAAQKSAGTFSWVPLRRFRHRRLYQVFFGYAVGAWVVLQIAAIVLPGLDWPRWLLRPLIVTLVAGFGEALLLGWALDRQAAGKARLPQRPSRRLGFLLLAIAPATAVAVFFLWHPEPGTSKQKFSALADAPLESILAKSVAVLPFENLSADKDNAFFADGVQDEILTDLSKVADLKVISRTSVMQYKSSEPRNLREIARQLGVANVLEGSVQRAGNRIKVTAQLIDARTDTHRWAEEYVDELSDVFAIQSKIAQAIAGQLQATISPQERAAITEIPTRDEQAYQLYLRAVVQWNEFDNALDGAALHKSILELLRQATERDPGFARAFAFMTEVQASVYFNYERTPANEVATRNDAETTARLRPGSSEAHMAMAHYYYMVQRDLARANEEFAQVLRQSPNDAEAYSNLGAIARRQGRWEDALNLLRRGLELDPESSATFLTYVDSLDTLKRYSEVEAAFSHRIATHPQQLWLHLVKIMFLLESKGDTHSARVELALLPAVFDPLGNKTALRVLCDEYDRDFAAVEHDLADCPMAEINGIPRAVFEGFNAYYRSDAAKAAASFRQVRPLLETRARAEVSAPKFLWKLAQVDAILGDKEAALAEGRRALAMGPQGDTFEGASAAGVWASVLALAGERDEAIRTLQKVSGQPYGPEYGDLRFAPSWDSLRGDPRFEALVANLAPKESK